MLRVSHAFFLVVVLTTIPPSHAGEVQSYTTPGELRNTLDDFTPLLEIEQILLAPPAPAKKADTSDPKAETRADTKTAATPETKSAPAPPTPGGPARSGSPPSRVGEASPQIAGRTDLQGPVTGNAPPAVDYRDLSLGDLGAIKELSNDVESVSARAKRVQSSMPSIGSFTQSALKRSPSQNPKLAALKEGQATLGLTADPAARAGFGDRNELTFPSKPGALKNDFLDAKDEAKNVDRNADRGKTKEEKEREKEQAEKKEADQKKADEAKMQELAETPTPYKREDYDRFRDFIASKQVFLRSAIAEAADTKFANAAETIFDTFADLDQAAATRRAKDAYEAFVERVGAGTLFPIVQPTTPASHQGGPVHSPR